MLFHANKSGFPSPHWCGLFELPYAGGDQGSELQTWI